MDLEAKFALGASNHTYRRIDAEYKTNIFVGYNDDGLLRKVGDFVMVVSGRPEFLADEFVLRPALFVL